MRSEATAGWRTAACVPSQKLRNSGLPNSASSNTPEVPGKDLTEEDRQQESYDAA